MTVLHPTNDSDRISLLRTALESHLRGQTASHTYLAEATADALGSQAAQLEAAVQTIAQAQATHQQALATAKAAVVAIQAQVRHTWDTVRTRVRWRGISPAVLPYYHLRARRIPRLQNRAAWLEMADRLVQGDQAAMEAGYASAIDPVALPAARDALQAALDDLNEAKQQLHSARQTGRAVRRSSDRLIRHLVGDLRHALRDHSATDQQQIMRTYGVHFRRSSTQPVDEQAQPPSVSRSAAPRQQAAVAGWQLQPDPVPVEG